MAEEQIHDRIEKLVSEEQELYARVGEGGFSAAEHNRRVDDGAVIHGARGARHGVHSGKIGRAKPAGGPGAVVTQHPAPRPAGARGEAPAGPHVRQACARHA